MCQPFATNKVLDGDVSASLMKEASVRKQKEMDISES